MGEDGFKELWYNTDLSVQDIADKLGLKDVRNIRRRAKRMGLPDRNHLELPNIPDAVRAQNDQLISELKRERLKTKLIAEACVESISKYKISPISRKKKSTKKKQQEMHLLRSDAQVGELIKPEDTSGIGNYNYDIYKRRLNRLLDKVLLFREQDSPALGLSKMVIPNLGDQVQGEHIYRGQAFHIDRILVDQLFGSLFDEVNSFYLPLAREFDRIEIPCVAGNHGRVGRKGESPFRTNWDYVFYRCLKTTLEQAAPHVKVHVSESPTMLMEHGKHLFAYGHGDDVNSWMGIPYYGLNRKAWKTDRLFNRIIDYHCVGHFHVPANLADNIIINGNMVGGSDLSINKMHSSTLPSQTLFYHDPENGVNRMSYLYLDELSELTADSNGILTPIHEGY